MEVSKGWLTGPIDFDDFVVFFHTWLGQQHSSCLVIHDGHTGWDIDREGPKSDEFSRLVMAIGVQFDLAGCADGLLRVSLTEKRPALLQFIHLCKVGKSCTTEHHKACLHLTLQG